LDTSSTHTLIDDNDIDFETSVLIAELFYEDLQSSLNARKGKSAQGTPLSDAEYALQVQSEQLEGMLNEMQDARIARRMTDAMSLDRQLIQQLVLSERVAQQDREAAIALDRGQLLPQLTDEQRAMERNVDGLRDDTLL
jgi:phosphoenolpyruvate-protein kinase (PTS system EI component)